MGYALKLFVEDGGVSAVELSNVLSISRQTVYQLYGNEILNKQYVYKLSEKGYNIPGVTVAAEGSNISNFAEPSVLARENEHLRQVIEAQKITIDALKGTLQALKRK